MLLQYPFKIRNVYFAHCGKGSLLVLAWNTATLPFTLQSNNWRLPLLSFSAKCSSRFLMEPTSVAQFLESWELLVHVGWLQKFWSFERVISYNFDLRVD